MHSYSILQTLVTIILCSAIGTSTMAQTDIKSKDLQHKKSTLPSPSDNSGKKTVDLTQISNNTNFHSNKKSVQPILQHQADGSIFIKRSDFNAISIAKREKIVADKRYKIID